MLSKINFVLIIFLTGIFAQQNITQTYKLKSEVFGNERTIRVWLPNGYDKAVPLKVLYMNDGQNLYGDNNFGSEHEWRIDETADSLISAKIIEPIIIVGIDHAKELRDSEYVPWQDEYRDPPLPNPEGEKYPEFLIKEVMPFIESKFNVLKGPQNTGLGGASHGGLITLYTGFTHPEKFGFIIAESPSLYVHQYKIFDIVEKSKAGKLKRIYVAMGTNESSLDPCDENFKYNKLAVNDTKKLKQIMLEKYSASDLLVVIDSCATHHEFSWAKRFPVALKFALNSN